MGLSSPSSGDSGSETSVILKMVRQLDANPSLALQLLNHFPVIPEHAREIDVYGLYIRLMDACNHDEEEIEYIQAKMMDYLSQKTPSLVVHKGALTPDQEITGRLYLSMMTHGHIDMNDQVDFEFDRIVKTLHNKINTIVDSTGLPPLIQAITHAHFPAIHKTLDAIRRNGDSQIMKIDQPSPTYPKGSALFFACAKGATDQTSNGNVDQQKTTTQDPLDTMASVIKKLIEFGASCTKKWDENENKQDKKAFSPLEIMFLQRNTSMVGFMFEHMDHPLTENELEDIEALLEEINYLEMKELMEDLAPDPILPGEEEWNYHYDELHACLETAHKHHHQLHHLL